MICQSFDITHYRQEHNIDQLLRRELVKLFYRNGSKSSVALREYLCMNGLRRGPMSTNGLKKMLIKFENIGDFGVAHGRGRLPMPMELVDEVAVAGNQCTSDVT